MYLPAEPRSRVLEQKKIVVIGAGVVGTCCALEAVMRGHKVSLIDPRAPGAGTSFGNAGSIAIGSIWPSSTPGLWKQLPKMIIDPKSPVQTRWSTLPQMAPWLARFFLSGRPSRIADISAALAALAQTAMPAHTDLMKQHGIGGIMEPVGWLKVYPNAASFQKSAAERAAMEAAGVNTETLDEDELRQLEPNLHRRFKIGFFQPDNGFVTSPLKLTEAYAEAFCRLGGVIFPEEVRDFTIGADGPSQVITDLGMHDCDMVVLATGAKSQQLARRLGAPVLVQAERGYHANIIRSGESLLRRPTVIGDVGCVIAPMADGYRITTGSELSTPDAPPDFRLLRRHVARAREALPGLDGEVNREWMGRRPATPDSLPVIGRSPRHQNVLLAFGHGHIGLTLSARTGQIIGDLIDGNSPGVDLSPYRPNRF